MQILGNIALYVLVMFYRRCYIALQYKKIQNNNFIFIAAAAAEMAYHNTRPPIAVTFPKPLVALLQRGWHANPEVRCSISLTVLFKKENASVFV